MACKGFFTDQMTGNDHGWIISSVDRSSRDLNEISQVVAICHSLFTEKMQGHHQAEIILDAIGSEDPDCDRQPTHDLKELKARGQSCHKIFTDQMTGNDQSLLIRVAFDYYLKAEQLEERGMAIKNILTDLKVRGGEQVDILKEVFSLSATQSSTLVESLQTYAQTKGREPFLFRGYSHYDFVVNAIRHIRGTPPTSL